MLSIELIRRDPDLVAAALARRGEETALPELLELDASRRTKVTERDELRATHNEMSREFGQLMAASNQGKQDNGDEARMTALRAETQQSSQRIETLENEIKEAEATIETMMLVLPNLPLDTVPEGLDDSASTIRPMWSTVHGASHAPSISRRRRTGTWVNSLALSIWSAVPSSPARASMC